MTLLGYKIHLFTDEEKLFTIRETEPEKLLMLHIPGCLGKECEPLKLLNILSSEPWLQIEWLLIEQAT